MTSFLVKRFVKEHQNIEKVSVRTAYGVLASIVGIICNVLLFLLKAGIGFWLHSVSVMADAFNNLSDAGSAIISLVGMKIAEKPADKEHPFGHGRMEYIAALVVAFLIMQVGFTFFKDAVVKIRQPQDLNFQVIPVLILVLSLGVKLWLGLFNRQLGGRIDSKVLKAAGTDALNDVLITAATIFSLVIWQVLGINIDGWIGIGVALAVMWAGIEIVKDTLEPLLGEAITMETYQEITSFVERYDGIVGSHDLIVHNYGPGRSMASIHAEVPNDSDIEEIHEIIDRIEREAKDELGLFLVIHMDPIETRDEVMLQTRERVEAIVKLVDRELHIHDFRMVEGKEQINLIFDMVVPHEYSDEQQEQREVQIRRELREIDSRYECVITTEKGFIAAQEEA